MPKVFMLTSAAEVIAALGGPAKAGRLVGRSTQSMSNAQCIYHRLPRDTYAVMTRRLRRLGYTAPSDLWGMAKKPVRKKRAAPEQQDHDHA